MGANQGTLKRPIEGFVCIVLLGRLSVPMARPRAVIVERDCSAIQVVECQFTRSQGATQMPWSLVSTPCRSHSGKHVSCAGSQAVGSPSCSCSYPSRARSKAACGTQLRLPNPDLIRCMLSVRTFRVFRFFRG